MRQLVRVLGVAALGALSALALAAHADQKAANAACADCHDELSAHFASSNPHALDRPGTPSCEGCHGDASQHMEEADPTLISIPHGQEGARLCLDCHSDLRTAFTSTPVHDRGGVLCFECHQMHATGPPAPALLRGQSDELCARCHNRETRSFSRPFGHQLGRGGLSCVSCHNPHGGAREHAVEVDRSGQPVCVSCHAEKRGPRVFPHNSTVVEGCTACHQPHGSSNPHALVRSHVATLCLECHSPIDTHTLGSQPPSFHDLRSPRYRDCTVCHVAVHGSNSSPLLLK